MSGKYAFFGRCLDRCESPIERHFLAALVVLADTTFEPFDAAPKIACDSTGVELGQQVPCGAYRIDFTLTLPGAPKAFAIELDGYAFHGSTPEQFERDAAKHRALVAAGWTLLRFAGREIIRDARGCAQRAMLEAAKLVDAAPSVDVAERIPHTPDATLGPLLDRMRSTDATWEEQVRLATQATDIVRARQGLPGKAG